MTLRAELQKLTAPSTLGALALGPELCPGCRLAVTHDGLVALALPVVATGSSSPRRFANLHYDPPHAREIVGSEARRTESLATLVCRTKDAATEDAFLRIALALFDSPRAGVTKPTEPTKLTEAELEGRIDELVSLFRALSKPSTQTIQALWCELAVVLWAPEPRVAISAWRSRSRGLHDFSSGADRLEVKSCSTEPREHAVRLEQLHEAPGGRTSLVSILVSEDDEGETVADLVGLILGRVGCDVELRRRLETIVTHSLGRDWREAAEKRFSLAKAKSGFYVYDVRDLPTVPRPIPTEVKGVSFTVDLSTTSPLSRADARARGAFFEQMIAAVST